MFTPFTKDSCRKGFSTANSPDMAETGKSFGSLRFNRFDIERLGVVLAFSLAAHLVAFGGYEFSKEFNLFPWLRLLAHVKQLPPQIQQEAPVEFAMVENPTAVAPKNAKYYGAQNSVAGDQSHGNQNEVELKGTQTEIPKTESAPRTDFDRLQPQAPAQESQPATEPGDLILAKPQKPQTQQTPSHPQKLSQVEHMPGSQMQQNGGVHRVALEPSLDVKATPFGGYDQQVFDAIQQYWNDELDKINYDGSGKGRVVLRFHLHFDGHVSDMEVLNTSEDEMMTMMCRLAVETPAPYGTWTEDMRHIFGAERIITITFLYE